ncbi:MAG: succinate dehydrogenase iron-sulfur subunit [Bacillota bacterium]|jgi:succinate dehydrogenase / fumarate reductase iron-sulfur subunit
MTEKKYFILKIKRQDDPHKAPYWEEFHIDYKPNMNVISSLMEIQRHPVNAIGEKVNPVVFECNCYEEVCGACTMIINGRPQQACSALIDRIIQKNGIDKPIILEPLTKFPVVRDLMVNRKVLFDNLRRARAWIPVDGSFGLGPGPRYDEKKRAFAYRISRCMTCGCCAEACPNFNAKSDFMGPHVFAQVKMFNMHPIGSMQKDERLKAIMGHGGIQDCGNAQNCAKVCPKNIPLLRSIAELNLDVNLLALKKIFKW